MTDSILDSTKKVCGVSEDYDVFDVDILMHINSALSTLTQIGVGPPAGFMVNDSSETWENFLGTDPRLNSTKTYVYMKTRLAFDPPASSYVITAMQDTIRETEWRLNVTVEHDIWVDPEPVVTDDGPDPFADIVVFHGGTP